MGINQHGRNLGYKKSYFGQDTFGHDVKAFGTTTGKYFEWDESADTFTISGTFAQTGAMTITGNTQQTGTFTVGVDDTGYDVKFFGATASKYFLWDESADEVVIAGDFDITGNSQFTGTITVGVDDTGHDVKFFGATSGSYMLWDESADKLIVVGTADLGTSCEADAYTVGGVAGADFNGAVTNLTVVKGIVTAAS